LSIGPSAILSSILVNPRQHSQRQINQIADSIREFGFIMPLVVDPRGQVVIGHARVLAAKKLQMLKVPIVEIRHLSKAQLKALRIAIINLHKTLIGTNGCLGRVSSSLKELDGRLRFVDHTRLQPAGDRPDPADATGSGTCRGAPMSPTRQSPGCRFASRVMSGSLVVTESVAAMRPSEAAFDVLMKEELAQVVFVDPPYNVKVDGHVSGKGKVRHREFAQGVGRTLPGRVYSFSHPLAVRHLQKHSKNGAIHYVCMDWRHADELIMAGPGSLLRAEEHRCVGQKQSWDGLALSKPTRIRFCLQIGYGAAYEQYRAWQIRA